MWESKGNSPRESATRQERWVPKTCHSIRNAPHRLRPPRRKQTTQCNHHYIYAHSFTHHNIVSLFSGTNADTEPATHPAALPTRYAGFASVDEDRVV